VQLNPSGKYNLNFIDWNNEFEAIWAHEGSSRESPIDGMDIETFERLYVST